MLFIFVAWLLVLLTFTIWMRALHSIQIYTNTPLELHEQALQIKTVVDMTQLLIAVAIACVGLHFVLQNDGIDSQNEHVHNNASLRAFDIASFKRHES